MRGSAPRPEPGPRPDDTRATGVLVALVYSLGACGLLLGNYYLSRRIARNGKIWLWIALTLDLGVLAWFKYSVVLKEMPFFAPWASDTLPLGISFYTFQMIAYQVDLYHNRTKPASLGEFAFFILFFPQLIAGPIVHYATIFPQLKSLGTKRCCDTAALGVLFFVIGMAKKVILADGFAKFADAAFAKAASGVPAFWEAWQGLMSYSLQIYFDFCAYSEMAIGLGLIFGLRLPVNFFSPYKAEDFRDFWRRWHITLSAFLRDYLYIPLGGNRLGLPRTMLNVILVMTLAGAWHGAGWTFLLWGMAHGILIALDHLLAVRRLKLPSKFKTFKILVTFTLVTLLWVLFRSPSLTEAWRYRDWVVRALNHDLPFDQFIVHQIAGDLLPIPGGREFYEDGLVATTFLTNGIWDRGDADKEKLTQWATDAAFDLE